MSDDQHAVLIVEDEPDLADLYAAWLQNDYRVRVANGGSGALELVDDDVSVVLLDRRMPDMSGDEVLEAIRDAGFDCRVAMVTAVEPDFDIVEMGFDDYLVKPVSKDALRETVSNLLLRNAYDEGMQRMFSLASKKALLESEKGPAALEESEQYREMSRELSELRESLDSTLEELSRTADVGSLYRGLSHDGENDDDRDDDRDDA